MLNSCMTLLGTKIHVCARGTHIIDLGFAAPVEAEYVDVACKDADEIRMQNRALYKIKTYSICNHCDGSTPYNCNIPMGEQ